MKVIYLAGPYSAKTEWGVFLNIVTAHVEAKGLWMKGWAVICPHSNTAYMDIIGRDGIMAGDLEILSRCDAVCMLSGWEKSEGATMEFDKARELGIVTYFSPEEVPYA